MAIFNSYVSLPEGILYTDHVQSLSLSLSRSGAAGFIKLGGHR